MSAKDFDVDTFLAEVQAEMAARTAEEVAKDEAMDVEESALNAMSTWDRAVVAGQMWTPEQCREAMTQRNLLVACSGDRWQIRRLNSRIRGHPITLTLEELMKIEGADISWLSRFIADMRESWRKDATLCGLTIEEYAYREPPEVIAWLKVRP